MVRSSLITCLGSRPGGRVHIPNFGTPSHYLGRGVRYQARSIAGGGEKRSGSAEDPRREDLEDHVVRRAEGEPDLLYVDLHLVHEVTSAQAFDGLRLHGRPVRRPDLTLATMDHNVPTTDGPVTDEVSARQMQALQTNADEFGITLYPWGSGGQGSCT